MEYDHFPQATVVAAAYPINDKPKSHSSLKSNNNNNNNNSNIDFNDMIDNDERNNMDETIERSGNLFSQLDYMLEAVQMEKSALDSMRDSLKELETLRSQVSHLTKKLFEADQTNVNLRSNLNKMQEAYIEVKKAKSDIEGGLASLKLELGKTKEICNKERNARLNAQNEIVTLKDQLSLLEKKYDDLARESRTIDSVQESNSILQQEVSSLRQRYREEKSNWQMQMRHMESQYSREMDVMKSDIRALAMRTLDIVGTQNYDNNMSMGGMNNIGSMGNMNMSNMNNMNMNSMNMSSINKQKQYNSSQRNMQFQGNNASSPSPLRYMDQTDSSQASASTNRDSFLLSDYYGEDVNGQSYNSMEDSGATKLSIVEVGDNDGDKPNRNYQAAGFEQQTPQYRGGGAGGGGLKLPSI